MSLFRRRAALASLFALFALPALAQTRILETTFGPVEIPADPQRIVTMHNIATIPLIEQGGTLVGRGAVYEEDVAPGLWPKIADVPEVELESGEPNYELIASLEPDLIFDINLDDAFRLERLRQIAPVVLIGIRGSDRAQWQSRARQVADAAGLLDNWQQTEAEFTARQAALKGKYGELAADYPLALWDAWEFGVVSIFPSNTMVGRIIEPAGAHFAAASEALALETGEEVEVSQEQMLTALGDAKVIMYGSPYGYDGVPRTRALPLYQRVPAVIAGQEFEFGPTGIAGYADASIVLDMYELMMEQLAKAP